MTNVAMKEFGKTLTDRADGKMTVAAILKKYSLPIRLDFTGVIALGSSFGDEVVLKIAEKQGGYLHIAGANGIIKNSLLRIVEDTSIELFF